MTPQEVIATILAQLNTLGPTGKGGLPSYDEVPAGQYNPKPGATPKPYSGRPVFGKFTGDDELRHKTLNRYLEDPNVDLNNPKVKDLLEVLGLTDVSGMPLLRNIDLNDYFRGSGKLKTKFIDPNSPEEKLRKYHEARGLDAEIDPATGQPTETYDRRLFRQATQGMENPPPYEGDSVGTGYTSVPETAIPVDRGAFMYEPQSKEKKSEARQVIDGIDVRMRNRILNDYFNGLLRLPMGGEDDQIQNKNDDHIRYFQPIANLIQALAGGQT